MPDQPLPPGFVEDAPLPAGFVEDNQEPDHVKDLGALMMKIFQQALKKSAPGEIPEVAQIAAKAAPVAAPGVVAGLSGTPLPPDASFGAKVAEQASDPTVLASAAASGLTGGAALPARVAAQVGLTGAAGAGREALREIRADESLDLGQIAKEGLKAGGVTGGIEAAFGLTGKAFKMLKPSLTTLGAQLIHTTSAIPEKYGKYVLENPSVLTEAPTLKAAQKIYRAAVEGRPGVREYLEEKTGKVLMKTASAEGLIDDIVPKLDGDIKPTLEEALAARQATAHLLRLAKYGSAEQLANKSRLLEIQSSLDDFLESGMPGFQEASKGYFEANAREAFRSILPQKKNMSANVLRSLGALATLGAGAILQAPYLLVAAAPFSPRMTGLGIRAGSSISDMIASQSAQFAAKAGALKASEALNGKKR